MATEVGTLLLHAAFGEWTVQRERSWDQILVTRLGRLGLSQVIFKGAPVIIKGLQKEE